MVEETLEEEIIIEEEEVITEEELQTIQIAQLEDIRLVEEARQKDLKDRYASLHDHRIAGAQLGLANVDLFFHQLIMGEKNHAKAEKRMQDIEEKDKLCYDLSQIDKYIKERKLEYVKIDVLLLEAIAEKEEGNTTKMVEYLEKRAAIKTLYPKV